MIKCTNVSFGFPQKDLYHDICFEIEQGDHAVLIGSNGTGKSTLVDMLVHTDDYLYDGKIVKEDNLKIGFVGQFVKHESEDISAYDYLAKPFIEKQAQMDEVCAQMETAEDMDAAYAAYEQCMDEFNAMDGYNYEVNIKKQLAIANLSEIEQVSVNKISGGEFKLLSIIRNLMMAPQLLIMDEPDVFLDFRNIVGLSNLINKYTGTVLVITHSRLLISQCFNKVLHLENMELQEFPGTFAEYNLAMLETKIEMQEQATKDQAFIEAQQKLVERMRAEATRITNPAKGRQLKARVSYLERLQQRKANNPFIEKFDYDFTFGCVDEGDAVTDAATQKECVLSVKDYALSFDREILKDVSFDVYMGDKVAIVGENGTGKTSMLNDLYKQVCKTLGEDQVGFFSQIYHDDANKLSGGEQNIKQIMDIAARQTRILFLDEPTSHLDIHAQLALEKAVRAYPGAVVMVSHDFYTVANCVDRIIVLEDGTARETSSRSYRKSIYKKYFQSDIFEGERLRIEREMRINKLLKDGKYEDAKKVLE